MVSESLFYKTTNVAVFILIRNILAFFFAERAMGCGFACLTRLLIVAGIIAFFLWIYYQAKFGGYEFK